MLGRKERAFGPLPSTTLEALIPPDHVYRRRERPLDLSFVLESCLSRTDQEPQEADASDHHALALAPNCVPCAGAELRP